MPTTPSTLLPSFPQSNSPPYVEGCPVRGGVVKRIVTRRGRLIFREPAIHCIKNPSKQGFCLPYRELFIFRVFFEKDSALTGHGGKDKFEFEDFIIHRIFHATSIVQNVWIVDYKFFHA